jgi:hypothetical protein
MRLLALVLALLALTWCFRLEMSDRALRVRLDAKVIEKIIYHIEPKHAKPRFGMTN